MGIGQPFNVVEESKLNCLF